MPGPIKPPKLGKTQPNLAGTLSGPKPSLSTPKPQGVTKVGMQATAAKTPKMKSAPDAFAPPSQFFKSEIDGPKHPNLRNLWDFMNKKHKKSST
jgi:hypothetical protein